MEKLLHSYNKASESKTHRFIFKNIEKTATQPTGTSGGSLNERMEKKFNTTLNVESAFNPDFNVVLNELGKKAAEKNPELSAESIKQNLIDTLKPGKTLDDVWAYLQSKDCQTAAIMDGHLKFFAGPRGAKEISLSEFYKPMEMKIGGEGTLTHEYLLKRQEMLQQSMQSLAALKGELPELPPNKNS